MTREKAIEILKEIIDTGWLISDFEKCVAIDACEMAIEALEQEPILDRDCEHCSKTYGTLGCCTTVSNKWVYSCKEGQREYLLDQIRAEIDEQYDRVYPYNISCAEGLEMALEIIEKYKAESEDNE